MAGYLNNCLEDLFSNQISLASIDLVDNFLFLLICYVLYHIKMAKDFLMISNAYFFCFTIYPLYLVKGIKESIIYLHFFCLYTTN